MRTLPVYSLLMLVLLTACGGCQEINSPANPTPDPKCRVATQITKQLIDPGQTSSLDIETVSIGGESFQVSTTKKSVYTYDAQGRILTEYNTYPENKADSVLYSYRPGAVSIRTIKLTDRLRTESTGTLVLNENGFLEDQGYFKMTYDKDGYLLSRKGEYVDVKIVNGNEVEEFSMDPDRPPGYITTFKYDLNKPGLMPIKTFYGWDSRNLCLGYTLREKRPLNQSAEEYNVDFSYIFDRNDLVARQIYRRKDGERAYIFSGGFDLRVHYFTYKCP